MHIDFAPPSNGTYNNAGSSRQLANYLEHEDLERMEKGIYTEGFFNATRKKLVTLDFCIFLKLSKRKRAYGIESIHSRITETLFHF